MTPSMLALVGCVLAVAAGGLSSGAGLLGDRAGQVERSPAVALERPALEQLLAVHVRYRALLTAAVIVETVQEIRSPDRSPDDVAADSYAAVDRRERAWLGMTGADEQEVRDRFARERALVAGWVAIGQLNCRTHVRRTVSLDFERGRSRTVSTDLRDVARLTGAHALEPEQVPVLDQSRVSLASSGATTELMDFGPRGRLAVSEPRPLDADGQYRDLGILPAWVNQPGLCLELAELVPGDDAELELSGTREGALAFRIVVERRLGWRASRVVTYYAGGQLAEETTLADFRPSAGPIDLAPHEVISRTCDPAGREVVHRRRRIESIRAMAREELAAVDFAIPAGYAQQSVAGATPR